MNTILPVHYLPSIQYFSKFLLYDKIVLDDKEGFERQTYRNRCYIAGANGKLSLIIPIQNRGNGQTTFNVRIDNTNNWQRIHWQSIRSAYGKAPFFEHYADYFLPLFTTRFEFLFPFDFELIKLLMKLIGIEESKLIEESENSAQEKLIPAGEFIHPKKDFADDKTFHPRRYLQAFEERLGFLPNLSIIDALFNLGPGVKRYLEECVPSHGQST